MSEVPRIALVLPFRSLSTDRRSFQFHKGGHEEVPTKLHSIVCPAETAKNGCKKTENE